MNQNQRAEFLAATYADAILRRRPEAQVRSLACPLFVPLAEEGWFDGPIAEGVVSRYLEPLFEKSPAPDCLVLGCTHYPIVEENFHECYPEMHLINPALEQANAVKAYLTEQNALNPQEKGKFVICTSGDPQVYVNVGKRLGLFEASELKVVHI